MTASKMSKSEALITIARERKPCLFCVNGVHRMCEICACQEGWCDPWKINRYRDLIAGCMTVATK